MARNLVECVKEISGKRKTALGRKKKSQSSTTHESREEFVTSIWNTEFNETLNARKMLELHMDSALPCKSRKTSGNSLPKALEDPQERSRDEKWQGEKGPREEKQNYCRINVRGSESTRQRLPDEDHIAENGAIL